MIRLPDVPDGLVYHPLNLRKTEWKGKSWELGLLSYCLDSLLTNLCQLTLPS